ncbi:MAG: (d)CMP kinase [Myxococcales bacterium]|nr:(d)CMP kinase [Myxococcales bacterium]
MIIAIDGPAGAGKSTVSKQLADALGMVRLDTGALYRLVALAALRAGLDPDAPDLDRFVGGLGIEVTPDHFWLNGEDVTAAIRKPAVSAAASQFAAVPAVRSALLGLQQRLGRAKDSVVDGRDIGTVVFPDAEVKIFLTAGAKERARRRLDELQARGIHADFAEVLDEIVTRDRRDTERAAAPLRKADDAIEVDSSGLSIDEVVARCAALVAEKRRRDA